MIGQRFNRLVVEAELPERMWGKRAYRCRCDCGAEVRTTGNHLKRGNTQSCGCYQRDRVRETHLTHGRPLTDKTYQCWLNMRRRCTDETQPRYDRYGGRGIKVCERWQSFENFLADMGEKPRGKSLDRYPDNDGDYESSNCRWATPGQQNRNKSNNRLITFDGKTRTLQDWATHTGINQPSLHYRLSAGWSIKDALTVPVGPDHTDGRFRRKIRSM